MIAARCGRPESYTALPGRWKVLSRHHAVFLHQNLIQHRQLALEELARSYSGSASARASKPAAH